MSVKRFVRKESAGLLNAGSDGGQMYRLLVERTLDLPGNHAYPSVILTLFSEVWRYVISEAELKLS